MHILPAESSLQVSWNTNIGDLKVEDFRVESESVRQYGAGMPIRSVTKNSFEDSGLHLGRRYFYNVFLTAQIKNEKRVSRAFPVTASPIKISEPISFFLEQDDSGTVLMKLNREPEPDEKIVFYRCDQPTALPNDRITTVPKLISELRLQQIGVKKEEDGSYSFKPEKNEKGYVYAVAVRGDTAVIGTEEYYENLETIEVINQRSDGVNMFLELKKWPETRSRSMR